MTQDRIGPTSRYARVERATHEAADGTPQRYLRRRFIPEAQGPELGGHEVAEGDRPDTVAARTLGDPEQFWRLCDANGVLHPRDLTAEVGRRIRVTLPGVDLA